MILDFGRLGFGLRVRVMDAGSAHLPLADDGIVGPTDFNMQLLRYAL